MTLASLSKLGLAECHSQEYSLNLEMVKVQMEDFKNDTPTVASKLDLGDLTNDTPTVASKLEPGDLESSPQKSGVTSLFIGGGLGCVLLLCLGLMASGVFFLVRYAGSDEVEAAGPEVETVTPQESELPVGKEAEAETEAIQTEVEVEVSEAEVSQVSTEGEPEMGQLDFSLEPKSAAEAVDSLFAFESGVSQIHVTFEYRNLTPQQTWTQVWFHNGNEVLSNSQPWLRRSSGDRQYSSDNPGRTR
jgi:hypothetical protein